MSETDEETLWALIDEDRRLEHSKAPKDVARRVAIAECMQRYLGDAPRPSRNKPDYDLFLTATMLAAQLDRLKSKLP